MPFVLIVVIQYEQPITNDKILSKNSLRPHKKIQNSQVLKICNWNEGCSALDKEKITIRNQPEK